MAAIERGNIGAWSSRRIDHQNPIHSRRHRYVSEAHRWLLLRHTLAQVTRLNPHVLQGNLATAIKHLDDEELDRL
jgi:hypothetical protein